MNPQHDEVYDYIIIGSGPSSCGLVHGLLMSNNNQQSSAQEQQNHNISICIIEAGQATLHETTYAKDWPKTSLFDNASNNHISTPQRGLCNRLLDVPIGCGLGGGTNINACLLCEPDYDRDFQCWPKRYQDGQVIRNACEYLLDVMRKSGGVTDVETCPKFMDILGGVNNNNVEKDTLPFDQQHVRLATANDGRRVNYFESLVQPLLFSDENQNNVDVKIRTNTVATRLLWDNDKRVNGVLCRDKQTDQHIIIGASKEVILCAGAIHSPVLLMRSGIGDESDLRKLTYILEDNGNFHNLPGVGKHLKDHTVLPRAFLTFSQKDCRQSLMGTQTLFNKRNDTHAQFMVMDGCVLGQAGPSLVSAVFRRDYISGRKCKESTSIITYIQQYAFHITFTVVLSLLQLGVAYIRPLANLITYHTVTILITMLNPKSCGSVTLTSSNQINIDPAYLTNSTDGENLVQAWNDSTRLKEIYLHDCWEILPGHLYKVQSLLSRWKSNGNKRAMLQNEILAFARGFMGPYFHWIGTCAMINTHTNNEAVADETFRVIGMQGLRICDASVFVDCVSAPTALTCASLGYILSEILEHDY